MMDNNQILDSEDKVKASNISSGKKILLGFLSMFFGWLSFGIGYGIALPGELNTIIFLGGFPLFFGGFILLIVGGTRAVKDKPK